MKLQKAQRVWSTTTTRIHLKTNTDNLIVHRISEGAPFVQFFVSRGPDTSPAVIGVFDSASVRLATERSMPATDLHFPLRKSGKFITCVCERGRRERRARTPIVRGGECRPPCRRCRRASRPTTASDILRYANCHNHPYNPICTTT